MIIEERGSSSNLASIHGLSVRLLCSLGLDPVRTSVGKVAVAGDHDPLRDCWLSLMKMAGLRTTKETPGLLLDSTADRTTKSSLALILLLPTYAPAPSQLLATTAFNARRPFLAIRPSVRRSCEAQKVGSSCSHDGPSVHRSCSRDWGPHS